MVKKEDWQYFPGRLPVLPQGNRALPDPLFQHEVDLLVDMLNKGGWLFCFRRHVPRALLSDWAAILRGMQAHHADDPIRSDAKGLRKRGTVIQDNNKRATIVIPRKERKWLSKAPPPLSPKRRIVPPIRSDRTYQDIADEFYGRFVGTGALRGFDPRVKVVDQALEQNERERLRLMDSPLPVTNFLPNIWAAFSRRVLMRMVGTAIEPNDREEVERRFVQWVALLSQERSKTVRQMESWLRSADLCIVQVSGAQFANAQYLGQRVKNGEVARRQLIHGALTYLLSKPI